jgi:hypothetical protein
MRSFSTESRLRQEAAALRNNSEEVILGARAVLAQLLFLEVLMLESDQ